MTEHELLTFMRDIRHQVEQRCDYVGEVFTIAGHLVANALESLPPVKRRRAFDAWVLATDQILDVLPQPPPTPDA